MAANPELMKATLSYLNGLKNSMGLQDWEIRLNDDPCQDGAWADISIPDGRKVAAVRLCSDFHDKSQEDQRHTIVHELLHCHVHGMCSAMRNACESVPSELAARTIDRQFDLAMEYAVDGIASIIAQAVPTPEEFAAGNVQHVCPQEGDATKRKPRRAKGTK